MLRPSTSQLKKFHLVAQLLGWVISQKGQIKYLRVVRKQQQYSIKVPKRIRDRLDPIIQPKCWLEIKGKIKLSQKNKSFQFQATVVNIVTPDFVCSESSDDCLKVGFTGSDSMDYDSASCEGSNAQICYWLEEGLCEHFRLRSNFRMGKRSRKSTGNS